MNDTKDQKKSEGVRNRRVHMANERTFLAWIRTSIGIMAFGFVVERFALFVRQFSFLVGTSSFPTGLNDVRRSIHESAPHMGYSSFFGMLLVGMGALIGILAFVRFKKVEQQIEEDTYQPSRILDMLLTLTVLTIGIFMAVYLYHSL